MEAWRAGDSIHFSNGPTLLSQFHRKHHFKVHFHNMLYALSFPSTLVLSFENDSTIKHNFFSILLQRKGCLNTKYIGLFLNKNANLGNCDFQKLNADFNIRKYQNVLLMDMNILFMIFPIIFLLQFSCIFIPNWILTNKKKK